MALQSFYQIDVALDNALSPGVARIPLATPGKTFRGIWIESCGRDVRLILAAIRFDIPAGARGMLWWGEDQEIVELQPQVMTYAPEGDTRFTAWATNHQIVAAEAVGGDPLVFSRFPSPLGRIPLVTPAVLNDEPYGANNVSNYWVPTGERLRWRAVTLGDKQVTLAANPRIGVAVPIGGVSIFAWIAPDPTGAHEMRLRRAWVRLQSASVSQDLYVTLARTNKIPPAGGTTVTPVGHNDSGALAQQLATVGRVGQSAPGWVWNTDFERVSTHFINTSNLNPGTGASVFVDLWEDVIPDGEAALSNSTGDLGAGSVNYGGGFAILLENPGAAINTVLGTALLTVS